MSLAKYFAEGRKEGLRLRGLGSPWPMFVIALYFGYTTACMSPQRSRQDTFPSCTVRQVFGNSERWWEGSLRLQVNGSVCSLCQPGKRLTGLWRLS